MSVVLENKPGVKEKRAPSATSVVTGWMKDYRGSGVQAAAVAEMIGQRLEDNPSLRLRWQNEQLLRSIYMADLEVVALTRSVAQLNRRPEIVDNLDKRAQTLIARWSGWLEHVGDHHVLLLDMTIDDLSVAIKERSQRIATEARVVRLETELGKGLAVGERVRDRFTVLDIERIWQSLE